jgi:hypothetical protein
LRQENFLRKFFGARGEKTRGEKTRGEQKHEAKHALSKKSIFFFKKKKHKIFNKKKIFSNSNSNSNSNSQKKRKKKRKNVASE